MAPKARQRTTPTPAEKPSRPLPSPRVLSPEASAPWHVVLAEHAAWLRSPLIQKTASDLAALKASPGVRALMAIVAELHDRQTKAQQARQLPPRPPHITRGVYRVAEVVLDLWREGHHGSVKRLLPSVQARVTCERSTCFAAMKWLREAGFTEKNCW